MNGRIFASAAVALAWGVCAAAAAPPQLDTVNTVPCAEEGGICRMPHPTNVYYGVPGKTNGRPFPQGGAIPCNAQTFGDPAPGQKKSCWYAPRVSDARRGGGLRIETDDRRGDDRDDREIRRRDRDLDERPSYRGRDRGDRDYDRPARRDDYDAPRRRDRRDFDDD